MNANHKSRTSIPKPWLLVAVTLGLVSGFLILPRLGLTQESTTSPTTDSGQTTEAPEVSAINTEIEAKRQKIQDLQKQIELFEQGVKQKQDEAVSLQNELLVLQGQIAKTELEIESLTFAIEEKELEIQALDHRIVQNERRIADEKADLAGLLRDLQRLDVRTELEVLIGHDSFAEFFDQLRYLEDLQGAVASHVRDLGDVRDELAYEKEQQEKRQEELLDIHDRLEVTSTALGQEKEYQSGLLAQTNSSEAKFNDLLQQSIAEQRSADAEIASLQKRASEVAQGGGTDQPTLPKDVTLAWPVTPTKGISAGFHDPTYIFRKYFEHPAIDIPTPQGTPIAAPADGYVARAKNAGFGYSYIMLIHSETLATVYGHVSRIDVSEESYVRQGQIIGLTGGLPGTAGAGRLTTGPHLHFEVRIEGIPVNPLQYLP